ncbi:MAG: SAM hydrolase/SAM-dependent halogenase family protein [Bacteroidales bacterium]|jgi:S-adenosylmethionine hydrolase|nr:SAM-dependent chlorinase/fluorinase [Bacteroidales bacterium]HPX59247.1 SAM-dependent chlorinase/fluorinase [Bacteroidales bacterium]
MSNIITLTTDWGITANYAAIFKAHLLKEAPSATIVDISHEVEAFNIEMGVYLLAATYPFFAKETVHIFGVDFLSDNQLASVRSSPSLEREHIPLNHYLAVKYKGHYFLARNNGFFSLLCEDLSEIEEMVQLKKDENLSDIKTFDLIPFLLKPAVALSKGISLKKIGELYDVEKIEIVKPQKPLIKKSEERGDTIEFGVKYIDNYGNIVTDLHKDTFDKIAQGRKKMWIYYRGMGNNMKIQLVDTYNNVYTYSRVFALFNTSGYLEIVANYSKLSGVFLNNSRDYDRRFILGFEDNNEK